MGNLTRGRDDLPALQRVLDERLLQPEQTWELQSLGVAFGDVLADMVMGLAWCEVTDEYGTDPTLRFRETSFQVNALTMISKRVETGRPVRLQDLVAQTVATLAGLNQP
jgi:hypothetical protein